MFRSKGLKQGAKVAQIIFSWPLMCGSWTFHYFKVSGLTSAAISGTDQTKKGEDNDSSPEEQRMHVHFNYIRLYFKRAVLQSH